ncbi:MAG: hypothetical protein R2854_04060 [Caldilineaceae bacterium]
MNGRPKTGLNIAFFGSSLVSAYWNGAATYYRGIIRQLHRRGHRVTFYEPDAYDRQRHRDIADPDWATVVVYSAAYRSELARCLEAAARADVVVKASGVGVYDEFLEAAVADLGKPGTLAIFWDVDAPATLERVQADATDPFRAQISRYDLILTYGGGAPVADAYTALGARACVPVYNAFDQCTHFPAPPDARFAGLLGFLGNRLPDREARVEEFFLKPRRACPTTDSYSAAAAGRTSPHAAERGLRGPCVYTTAHNAFNCTACLVLNVTRESMVRFGYSPATRL